MDSISKCIVCCGMVLQVYSVIHAAKNFSFRGFKSKFPFSLGVTLNTAFTWSSSILLFVGCQRFGPASFSSSSEWFFVFLYRTLIVALLPLIVMFGLCLLHPCMLEILILLVRVTCPSVGVVVNYILSEAVADLYSILS